MVRGVRADTTDLLAEPLGAATVAQALVHRPGEGPLAWAAYTRVHYFDIPGLNVDGTRATVARRVGDFLGEVVSGAFGSEEDAAPPPPDVVVWGAAPNCLAHRYVPAVSAGARGLWTLTPERLALHTETPAPPSGLRARAARVGSGLAKIGRDLAEIVTDRMTFGANTEGEPVPMPSLEPLAEVPRGQISGFEVARRSGAPVLRMRLVDGSGVDFLVGMTDQDECEYALGLVRGAPPLRPGAVLEWAATLAAKSLTQSAFLAPGEELVLAGTANLGYAGVQLGHQLRMPHTPLRTMPALNVAELRWPLPASTSREFGGWLDDPTIAFWAQADRADRDAVVLADLLAHTRGVARVVLTRARLAVVAATRLLATPPDPSSPWTALLELPRQRIRALTAELAGRTLPPKPLLRMDFTDGSTLRLRDPIAARQVAVS